MVPVAPFVVVEPLALPVADSPAPVAVPDEL
jgi:hypothetical protein